MIPRLVAATGAVLLWAYARACRERNATQQRLARANLLRHTAARPARCADGGREDGGCDRIITVDITPDTTKLDELRVKWSHGDEMPDPFKPPAEPGETWFDSVDELPPALQGVPPEEIAGWAAHFGHKLTPYEQRLAARSFEARRKLTLADVEIPPHNLRQRLYDATTKALNDAGGDWWREDSGDRYPGRGGW